MVSDDKTPLVSRTAFACPHCGAYTTQFWYKVFVDEYDKPSRTPVILESRAIDAIRQDTNITEPQREGFLAFARKLVAGKPFLEKSDENPYKPPIAHNLNLARCYNCKEIAVWVHDRMVYPAKKIDIQPNEDLPEHVVALFDEARAIVSESPKGAAALLRLCMQHLCIELGEPGKNLNTDIANLISKGLNPLVQQALDVVRVVGNDSVHPGEINLNDDRKTAVELFRLVNVVAEQMISHPKKVKALYAEVLPEGKREQIERRDAKASGKATEEDK